MGKVHFTNMIKIAIFSVLLFSLVVASPMSTKDRGLIDDLLSGDLSASGSAESEEPKDSDSLTDLLLGLIQQIVLQQINTILGISAPSTTTTYNNNYNDNFYSCSIRDHNCSSWLWTSGTCLWINLDFK